MSIGDPSGSRHEQNVRADNGSTAYVAAGNINLHNVTRIAKGHPMLFVLAALALIVVLLYIGKAITASLSPSRNDPSADLTAASTCRQFMMLPQSEREQVVSRIGMELGAPRAGHPWAHLSVASACGQAPDAQLGRIIMGAAR
ncbi:hypothetical protein ACQEU3_38240 [Spirillospora sp. CA-253888]